MHIFRSISSATFAWSSKLTVDVDSMGPGLQPVGARFSNFFLGKVSLQFILHGMSIFHDIQMVIYFGIAVMLQSHGWVRWWSYIYCVCWYDLDPIQGQGQGQGHGAFELPTTSKDVHADGDDRSPLAGLSGWCTLTVSVAQSSSGMFTIGRIAYRREGFSSPLKMHYRLGKGVGVHSTGEVWYLRLPCWNWTFPDIEHRDIVISTNATAELICCVYKN